MIEGVRDAKCGQAQAGRLAVLWRLQHVLGGQRSGGLVTQGKRILQELQSLGFRLDVLRTIRVLQVLGQLIAREPRPDEVVGSRDVFDLASLRQLPELAFPTSLISRSMAEARVGAACDACA